MLLNDFRLREIKKYRWCKSSSFDLTFLKISWSVFKTKSLYTVMYSSMEILLRFTSNLWRLYNIALNLKVYIFIVHDNIKIQSLQAGRKPISEYLSPEAKTVIEYDCMPNYANILVASIVDMAENRIIKSFGIKKGIELNNNSICAN